MKLVCSALMGTLILVAGCGPDQEPETTVDWGEYDAQVAAEAKTSESVVHVSAADGLGSLLNAERVANGLPPLTGAAQLTAAARAHAKDMVANGFFSHTGSDNSKSSDRVRRQGYGFCFVAENISQGYPSDAATMAGWMASPGHRANNLTTKATEYGVAKAGGYAVLVFGRPGC